VLFFKLFIHLASLVPPVNFTPEREKLYGSFLFYLCLCFFSYASSLARLPLAFDIEQRSKTAKSKANSFPLKVGGPLAKLMTPICRNVLSIKFVMVFSRLLCSLSTSRGSLKLLA